MDPKEPVPEKSEDAPAPSLENEAVFQRSFEIEVDGFYRFSLYSDDPATLEIDGDFVAFNSGDLPNSPTEYVIELNAGTHFSTLTYFEQDGGELLILDIELDRPVIEEAAFQELPEAEFEEAYKDEPEDDFAVV